MYHDSWHLPNFSLHKVVVRRSLVRLVAGGGGRRGVGEGGWCGPQRRSVVGAASDPAAGQALAEKRQRDETSNQSTLNIWTKTLFIINWTNDMWYVSSLAVFWDVVQLIRRPTATEQNKRGNSLGDRPCPHKFLNFQVLNAWYSPVDGHIG